MDLERVWLRQVAERCLIGVEQRAVSACQRKGLGLCAQFFFQ